MNPKNAKSRECYETDTEIIVIGHPYGKNEEDHSCDEMGCSSCCHVRFRFSKSKEKFLEKLIEFAHIVKECPANSVHLMPLAADALLRQLHTDSVVSEK